VLKPLDHLRKLSRRAAARRFLRDSSGAMAVEFAMVAAPLLFMLFAIIELALVFMVSSTLENATTEVARTIRTGAVQTAGGGSQTAFRNSICAKIGWMQSSCQTNLSVDVRTYAQFTNQNAPDPVSNKTFNAGSTTYSVGVQGDIVLVRSFYRWKLVSPFLTGGLERLSGGVTLLTAAATFKNEPY
jgi:Flp pilus assembly protein TadG